MADYNGINGGLVLIKKGTDWATATDIVGQGDASVTHGGAPIEINNKSTGGWRENLDGSISTKSMDIDLEITASSDESFETLMADAFAGTVDSYIMDFTDGADGYFYSGSFTPVLQSESAAKDTATTATIQFQSSGEIVRTVVVDGVPV